MNDTNYAQNREPCDSDKSSEAAKQQLEKQQLDESTGHRWWLFSVIIMIFASPFSIIFSDHLMLKFDLEVPRITHLLLSICLVILSFWGLIVSKKISGAPLKNALKGLVAFPFFGWFVFLLGVISAINKEMSNSREYIETLEAAASDITIASVVSLLVIFFTGMLSHYKETIEKAKEATDKALHAEQKIIDILSQIRNIEPQIENATRRCINVFNAGENTTSINLFNENIGNLLSNIHNSSTLEVFNDFSNHWKEHTERLYKELFAHKDEIFELTVFAALQDSYLRTETLNFIAKEAEPGKSGCEFPTRFVQYALTVQNVVVSLEKLSNDDNHKYSYHTILNRKPSQFFNIEDHGADVNWSLNFLEDFCRSHAKNNTAYQRFFITCKNKKDFKGPPTYQEIRGELDNGKILCSKKGNTPVFLKDTQEIPEEIISSLEKEGLVKRPGYVISKDGLLKGLPDKVNEFVADNDLDWLNIMESLYQYHSRGNYRPMILLFEIEKYKDFFRSIPQDLFAVRNIAKNEWVLCMGTMAGARESTSVTLFFATKARKELGHHYVEWGELTSKLDALFLKTDSANRNISLIGLEGQQ